MADVYVVLASFAYDDAPVYAGGLKECLDFARDFNFLLEEDRIRIRFQAEKVFLRDISTELVALLVVRLLPGPIAVVENVAVGE